ncbi:MAG: hypothetical protein LBI81_01965 [Puniceicoccales bacterium]|nr:hypothetical protein [Puniceicoccales bacterium]
MSERKNRGSILLFVLVCIGVLGGTTIVLVRDGISLLSFYKSVSNFYGSVDRQNKLHGIEEIESESMRALAFAAINRINEKGKYIFDAEASSTWSDPIEINLTSLLKEAGVRNGPIQYNSSLRGKIVVTPLDNKLPFIPKFEKEVMEVMDQILQSDTIKNRIKQGNVNAFLDDVRNLLKAPRNPLNTFGIEGLRQLLSWKPMLHNALHDSKIVLNELAKHITLCREVEAVNLFIASQPVKQAIAHNLSFGPREFAFKPNENKLQMALNPWKDDNSNILEEMIGYNTACKASDRSFTIWPENKVFLYKDKNNAYRSYSRVVEVEVTITNSSFAPKDKRRVSTYKYTYIMPNGEGVVKNQQLP